MSPLRGSLLIFAVMCAAVTTHGQAVTANLQGVVSDATGAVVSAATVTSIAVVDVATCMVKLMRACAEPPNW